MSSIISANTALLLLVMCGTALNFFATVSWAFAVPMNGSLWLLLVAFAGTFGSTLMISACEPAHDHETLQLVIACSSLSPLIAAGCWQLSPGTPNSNWVIALFILSSFGPIYGCKKFGSKITYRGR
jgi:hypothetical protein